MEPEIRSVSKGGGWGGGGGGVVLWQKEGFLSTFEEHTALWLVL